MYPEKNKGDSAASAAGRAYELVRLTRLHKFPFGSLLVFWPYGWGLAMAACNLHSPRYIVFKHAVIFMLVATLYHSAFCIWNDMCDRDLDGRVDRPLVTGTVSVIEAFVLFLALLALTFVAISYTNRMAFWYMVSSLPLGFLYPQMKHWTWWPQFWLGVGGSWGCIVAWASLAGSEFTPLTILLLQVLTASTISWIIMLDTMYGAQNRDDDMKVGIKLTARLFGPHIWGITAVFGAAFVALSVLAGLLNGNGTLYFLIGCCGVSLHIFWQLLSWNAEVVQSSLVVFVSNHYMGLFLFTGILLDYLST
ncbi:uncharacterized protein PHACADRAFT_85003 [Phanerochaete carnosa HHB-10118-sp]|uniref:Uncharacterized protein n=1 Tax=Phanerochaete carnosa (strain HHB-10118-sp) TaxID=650164 RepID=K5VBN5_PHACS|nr:uncharacterized protein PHACADRAFT_85003 [Phanerochaete carnosa HHB-10118-sp]EKM60306.1 hypothetical protein PHACADRAFT_85003 [Phanerochaete carnosa HHB-10118-sp]